MNDNSDFGPAKILWTGGWDSTFQLLRLLLLENRPVEPYYLIDEDRVSTGAELLAMKRIRERIKEADSSAASIIYPTRYFSVSQIPSHSKITNAYESIRNTSFIGSQYDWLARFCEDQEISGLQLCIHKDDKAAVVVAPMVSSPPRLGEQFAGTNEHLLFKYFDFPILDLTKADMADIAELHNWTKIMDMTWFCHSPRKGKPCGRCNPCKYTVEEGLGRRIPSHRVLVGRIYLSLVQPVKILMKKIPRFWGLSIGS